MTEKNDGEHGKFDLKKLIREKYPALPDNQRKVADYLLHNIREVPFLSIIDIEQKSGASKATVVRLAQSLGLSGFQEMRERLMEGVQSAIRQPDQFSLLGGADRQDTLTIVARQDVKNINETIKHLDKETFGQIASMILKASHVYTVGLGISSLMSKIFAYTLNQVAIRSTSFVHDYETFIEQLPFVTPDDLLIAFSFPPYSRETVDAAKAASQRGVPVVAITDRVTSPVTFYSRKVVPIRSQNMLFTNSFSAISVVINALATEVAVRNRTKAMKVSKEIDRLMQESGHYTEE